MLSKKLVCNTINERQRQTPHIKTVSTPLYHQSFHHGCRPTTPISPKYQQTTTSYSTQQHSASSLLTLTTNHAISPHVYLRIKISTPNTKTPLSPHQDTVSDQCPFQHTTLPPTMTQQYPKTTVNSCIMACMTRNIQVQTKYCFIHLNNILNMRHNLLKKNDSSIKFCDHKSSG